MTRRAVLLLLPLMVGCATPRAVVLERALAQPWYEVKSGRVRVFTQQPEGARSLAAGVEARRAAMVGLLGLDAAAEPADVRIVTLEQSEFDILGSRGFAGQVLGGIAGPILAITNSSGWMGQETAMHELAHLCIHATVGRPPPTWLDEGLAQWLQTIDLSETELRVGKPPRGASLALSERRPARSLLMQWRAGTPMLSDEVDLRYAGSWAWVSYLIAEHPLKMKELLRAFTRRKVAPEDGWAQAFPAPGLTDQDLSAWLAAGRVPVSAFPRVTQVAEQTERRLPRAEALELFAEMSVGRDDPEARATAVQFAQQALALDPSLRSAPAVITAARRESVYAPVPPKTWVPVFSTGPACADITWAPPLEGSTELQPSEWLPDGDDPWPLKTDGEAIEHALHVEAGELQVLAGSAEGPFVTVLRRAPGGHCTVGSWRAAFPGHAELKEASVVARGPIGLVLLGYDLERERRWVVLGTNGKRVWFAFKDGSNTQAITSVARLTDGKRRIGVIFGEGPGAEEWVLLDETLVRKH
jgi:hypothetical protein